MIQNKDLDIIEQIERMTVNIEDEEINEQTE